jgi:hypothetical protein
MHTLGLHPLGTHSRDLVNLRLGVTSAYGERLATKTPVVAEARPGPTSKPPPSKRRSVAVEAVDGSVVEALDAPAKSPTEADRR